MTAILTVLVRQIKNPGKTRVYENTFQAIKPNITIKGITINSCITISSKKAGHKLGRHLHLKNFEKNPLFVSTISGTVVSVVTGVSIGFGLGLDLDFGLVVFCLGLAVVLVFFIIFLAMPKSFYTIGLLL